MKAHISVCVCTYRRHDLLRRLLSDLLRQETDGLFTYSIVVVDNDSSSSAQHIFEEICANGTVDITYFHEQRRNISHARNLAVEKSRGDFVAFIDDDEFPRERWLVNLYLAQRFYRADGVLGPVLPHFEVEPPAWLVESKLCERARFPTGFLFRTHTNTRTGNVLLKMEIVQVAGGPFDPHFGTIGGGDVDYFKRMLASGKVFVWCDEACVFETVTLDRYSRSYYMRRHLSTGAASVRYRPLFSVGTAKSLIALPLYILLSPFLLLVSHPVFVRYAVKISYHFGYIMSQFGLAKARNRPY